ncbi:MAG: nucleotide exchange factor GrpE [Bacteroidetes bacterium]|nr:nucleotide exchange factor GrpE [Bacteroidota bacterium]
MGLDMCEREQNLLPPSDLEAEIQRLQEELIDEREKHVRTLADFKNYRRRIERDGNKVVEESMRGLFLSLLDIIDDIEKALEFANDAKLPTVEGLQVIHKKFLALLEKHRVLPFECVGTSFDHNLHEAVAMATHEGSEPRTVVDVLRRGYLLNNELLRAAQVRVSG